MVSPFLTIGENMYEKEALRLGEYLKDELGWEVYEVWHVCENKDCDYTTMSETHKWCPLCRSAVTSEPYGDEEIDAINQDLADALAYAMSEDGDHE